MNQKLEFKVESKVGSLDNVKHRPGGGDKKVFNDVEYLRQMSETSAVNSGQVSYNSSRRESATQVRTAFGWVKPIKNLWREVNLC